MSRRRSASVAANPVLIGAATVLVTIVAVFLAYNANEGLPFVPSYQLTAELPNAANLVRGNDVRIGGTRVGLVDTIAPKTNRDGSVTALITMKLEKSVEPIPDDSTLIVRPRSALGLKYVQITRGRSSRGFEDGATIPLRQARPEPVEIDQVFNTFDAPTRAAAKVNLDEFGNAIAGRGSDLNSALRDLDPLLADLEPVARNLASRRTDLGNFFIALERTARIVAPAAETQAALFRNLDATFSALEAVTPSIQASIVGGPPALAEAIRSFPIQRPFLRNSTLLLAELEPGVQALQQSAPVLANALTIGTPTLERSITLNEQIASLARSVQTFAQDPRTNLGITRLTDTTQTLNPTLAFINPAQTFCNYATLFFRNTASLLSEGDSLGTFQRAIIIVNAFGPNGIGAPSSGQANGPTEAGSPGDNYLRVTPYPYTAAPGQPKVCEAGNEVFQPGRQQIGHAAQTTNNREITTSPVK